MEGENSENKDIVSNIDTNKNKSEVETKSSFRFSKGTVFAILGIILIIALVFFIGKPNNASASSATGAVINAEGSQEISMSMDGRGYTPNSFVLKKGIPVIWTIDVQQLTGCNSQILVPDYELRVALKEGKNTIKFTPSSIGTVSFSCSMGMLRGSFLITDDGKASQQQIATATPQKGSSCSMAGGSCGCGG